MSLQHSSTPNSSDKGEPTTKEEWQSRLENFDSKQVDMDKFIMNYLVAKGFKEAAEKFQAQANVEPSVPSETLDTTNIGQILVREAVQSRRIQEAAHLVNKCLQLDNDRYLYSQQLRLTELIRNGKSEEALTFAQSKMSEAVERNSQVRTELERTLDLLLFEKPQNSPFADLLDQSHRQKVASELTPSSSDISEPTTKDELQSLLKNFGMEPDTSSDWDAYSPAELGLDEEIIELIRKHEFDEEDPLMFLQFVPVMNDRAPEMHAALVQCGAEKVVGNLFQFLNWDILYECRRKVIDIVPWAFYLPVARETEMFHGHRIGNRQTIRSVIVTAYSPVTNKVTINPLQFFEL